MNYEKTWHVDEAQEKNENRSKAYTPYAEVRIGVFAIAIRRKQDQSNWLCQLAGACDA